LGGYVTVAFDIATKAMTETLTAEQIQKIDGMMLALTGGLESPFLNERHMDALDMTDEQKAQFKAINEKMKEGRDRMIDEHVTKAGESLKSGKFEYTKVTAMLAAFKNYSRELKRLRSDVLTDAQIAKMRSLARMPRSLSVFNNLMPQWEPGPNSWKPGDGAPEQYREERSRGRGFPRAEQQ
jgi:Ni/Co efflux regulator RcnB